MCGKILSIGSPRFKEVRASFNGDSQVESRFFLRFVCRFASGLLALDLYLLVSSGGLCSSGCALDLA